MVTNKAKEVNLMKRLISLVFCAIMALLLLVACDIQKPVSSNAPQADQQNQLGGQSIGGAQIPNPFVDCKTLDEAQTLAGFDIILPEKMPEGYSQSAIRAVKNTMIEIIYKNGDEEIRIRKGTGSEDISGAYNEFEESGMVTVGSLQVMMKGSGGKINVASWFDGGHAFSVTINLVGEGIDKTVVSEIVSSVK